MTTLSPERHEQGEPCRLEGPLTLYTAETVRLRLTERLAQAGDLVLDVGAVDSCDCAGIQLLCAARKSASASGKRFELRGVSSSIMAAAESIGLDTAELSKLEA